MRRLQSYFTKASAKMLFWITSARLLVAITHRLLYSRPTKAKRDKRSQWTKIVVIRVDDIGDVVLSSGLLRELRRAYPSAEITLVARTSTFNLVELCPYVDRVLEYFCPQQVDAVGDLTMARAKFAQFFRAWKFARKHLRPLKPDVVLHPRYDVDRYLGSYLAYFSGAPLRVAFSTSCTLLKQQLTPDYDTLFTDVIHSDAFRHEAERSYEFLQFLNIRVVERHMETWWNSDDEAAVQDLLSTLGEHEFFRGRMVALGIGALTPARRWPNKHFEELGQHLSALRYGIVVIGGPDVSQDASLLAQKVPNAVVAAGRLSLRQSAALLQRTVLYVGNDSGPMHIAAAVGTPIVEISSYPAGSDAAHHRSPARFGPWQVRTQILQPQRPLPPCRETCSQNRPHCISQITVADVFAAATHLLSGANQNKTEATTPTQAGGKIA